MGFGIQLNKDENPSYSLRGKKAFPVTASGLVGINLKGRFHFDKEYKEVSFIDDAHTNSVRKKKNLCMHIVFCLYVIWFSYSPCYI